VTRVYAPVRVEVQPTARLAAKRSRSPKAPEGSPAPPPEWLAFEFLVNPGFDITLIPKKVGTALNLREQRGDQSVKLPWKGSEIRVLIKTVRMEIEDEQPFKADLAWAVDTDDVPLILGQKDVFSKFYDVDFSVVKGKVRFSMQGSEYDRILQRLNEASPRLRKFQVDDPGVDQTMQFIDADSVCFIQRQKRESSGKSVPGSAYTTRFTTADGKEYFSEVEIWQLDKMLLDNPSWFKSHKSNYINLRRILKFKPASNRAILFEGQRDFRDDLVTGDAGAELKRRLRQIV
jgi:hypothetical protein